MYGFGAMAMREGVECAAKKEWWMLLLWRNQ